MKVVVCVKIVPDERDIRVNPDRTIALNAGSYQIGTYDLNAIEAGAKLADSDPGVELTAMTARSDAAANSKAKKDILARGPDRLVTIEGPGLDSADPFTVATALAQGISGLGDVDLVLCGVGSGDMYGQQTGAVLGGILGWPALNEVAALEAQGNTVRVRRSVEDSEEEYEVSTPCVLSVTADINTPRVSSMRAILAAGKKPRDVVAFASEAPPGAAAVETLETLAPQKAARQGVVLPDASEASIDEFYRALRGAL
jgi:electron transfer flavoprotein beta subunit